MTKKQWLSIRPIVENALAFILYLNLGNGSNLPPNITPASMLVLAKVFTTQFEQEFHFED